MKVELEINPSERVLEAIARIKQMRQDSIDHDGGYPATKEGRTQSLFDHASVAEWVIFHSGIELAPPKPPIDTSLAASIERYEKAWAGGACHTTGRDEITDGCDCIVCDKHRIIEAARKWDQHCRKDNDLSDEFGKITRDQMSAAYESFKKSNDPDGVGEGWRLLKVGELVAHGDEVEKWDRSGWDDSVSFGWHYKEENRRRRRRIEAEQ